MTAARLTLALLTGAALGAPAAAALSRRRSARREAAAATAETLAVAAERAALKRIGVLAGSAPPEELFAAVAEELARVVDLPTGAVHVEMAGIGRYEPDNTIVVLATWGAHEAYAGSVGTRWPLEGDGVTARVHRTGRPARNDDYIHTTSSLGGPARLVGVRSAVSVPIVVDGRLWGAATVLSTRPEPLPPDTEARAVDFAALAATAISSAQAREKARRLSDEQAALRRVATLVAEGVDPAEVFQAVVGEVGTLCGADNAGMARFDDAGIVQAVAMWNADGTYAPLEQRYPVAGGGLSLQIARTGRPGRIDDWSTEPGEIADRVRELGYSCSVASPIHVEGRLWGHLVVHSAGKEPLPLDTEHRLLRFADLAGTSVANASARAELRRLVAEQDALRRMATLVARQPPLDEVFTGVVEELGRLLDAEDVRIVRYEPDGSTTVAASWGGFEGREPPGTTAPAAGGSVADRILRTARPARSDDPEAGARSTVGSPIVVAGRPWGAVIVASLQPGPLPAALSERLSDFTELVATAITNTTARSDLAASRARIVVATDEARRRFERDLHDGAQQRLVALALELHGVLEPHGVVEKHGAVEPSTDAAGSPRLAEVTAHLAKAGDEVEAILDELRELSRGIHPAILSEGGLGPALRLLARRSAVPVHLDVRTGGDDRTRLADRLEVATYYVISEALANVAKHAGASQVSVTVRPAGPSLAITVADDGVGGADPAHGSGLLGIIDRVEALGGTVRIDSPDGTGTVLHALLPLGTDERR